MGKLISVQDAAKRLGVCDQTLKNWAKDGTIQLKGMGKGSRKFWVDEDVIAAISDNAADVERAKEDINRMHEELHAEERALRHAIREAKHGIRLVGMGHHGLRTTEFFKSFTWAMSFIGVINEREKKVIDLILTGMSLEDIGDQFGITNSRVLQVFLHACRKCGRHGNLKRYVVEAENAKNELGKLRLDYEGLKAAMKKYEMQNEPQDRLGMLREKYGDDFIEEYRKLDNMCEKFSLALVEQNLSVRALNIIKCADIETIGDLVRYNKSDMLKFRNFGRKTLTELDDLLESLGLRFGMDVDSIISDRVLLREMISGEDAAEIAECQKGIDNQP